MTLPHDVPKPVADGVWIVDSTMRVLGAPLPIRMTVLRLADGGLWVHSPTKYRPTLAGAVAALGPIRHLVAPDTAHWTHLQPWQAAFPEARLWAPHGVLERARDQGTALRGDGTLGDAPPPDWDGQIDQALFQGRNFVEAAFFHRPSRSLVLTDTVQALETAKLPLPMRVFARLSGVAAPAGGTPRYLRLILAFHRAHNRAVAERLLALDPVRVIFAHGAWYEAEGAARLRRALGWLVR